jgi:hypothetical protein
MHDKALVSPHRGSLPRAPQRIRFGYWIMKHVSVRSTGTILLIGLLAALDCALPERAAGQVIGWGDWTYGLTNVPSAATNVTQVGLGYYAAVALRGDGTLVAWGASNFGLTNIPTSATNVAAIATGYLHTLALRQDGVILGWGDTTSGKTMAPASATNVTAIAAGYRHSLALCGDGTIVAWGVPDMNSPITNVPPAATNAMRIAAGGSSGTGGLSLALRRDGAVVPFGGNYYSLTTAPDSATNVVAVAAGWTHALALRGDGTVVGWGETAFNACTPPASATNIVALAAGNQLSMALRNDGILLAWGDTSYGLAHVPTNISFASGMAAGMFNALAVTNIGAPRFVDALGDLTAYVGRDFTLNALAVGRAPMSYQWRYNDTDLPGASQPTLCLTNVQFTNAGSYSVVISNDLGILTGLVANVSVVLPPVPPTIQTQPQSQTVFAGTNVSFSVAGTGYPLPDYQWRFNGKNIAGATSTDYSLPYVRTNHAGNYDVVLTNIAGARTSEVAVLTVNLPDWPVVTSWPADQVVSVGAPLRLIMSATGLTPISYQWQLNGTNLPGVTGPTVSFATIALADAGLYSVVMSNWGVPITQPAPTACGWTMWA